MINKEYNKYRAIKYNNNSNYREGIKIKSSMYYHKNKDKINLKRKLMYNYDIDYKEKRIKERNNYKLKYPEQIKISNRNYKINNRSKVNELKREEYLKFPERSKARIYTFKNNLRDTQCKDCKSKINLHFHHINYEKNKGYTLCAKCHSKLHNRFVSARLK